VHLHQGKRLRKEVLALGILAADGLSRIISAKVLGSLSDYHR
jgi:hypothetical protein